MNYRERICEDLLAKIEEFGIPILCRGKTSGAYTDGKHVVTFSVGLLGETNYTSNYKSVEGCCHGGGASVAEGGVTTANPKTWELVLNDRAITKEDLLALCDLKSSPGILSNSEKNEVRLLSVKEYKQRGLWMYRLNNEPTKVQAMRFNQPSTSQPYHHRHRANVLATLNSDGTATVYYVDDAVLCSVEPMHVLIDKCNAGEIESEIVPMLPLSPGWW